MRNVIVTGGTGALGRAVVAEFLAAGDRVVVPWIVKAEREEMASGHAGELADQKLVLLGVRLPGGRQGRMLVM